VIEVLGITIHLYGMILGLGVWVGIEAAQLAFPKIKKEIDAVFLWALIGGVVGARLYHVIDYWRRYYQYNLGKIWAVWEGGLGIWGAVLGTAMGIFLYGYFKKKNVWPVLEALAIGAPIAQAIGRLGNWVNGELYGKNGEPLFACEALLNLSLFVLLLILRKKKVFSGKLLGVYLIGYGVIRILLEGLRPNEVIWRIGGIPMAIIFGLLSMAIGFLILLRKKLSRNRITSQL